MVSILINKNDIKYIFNNFAIINSLIKSRDSREEASASHLGAGLLCWVHATDTLPPYGTVAAAAAAKEDGESFSMSDFFRTQMDFYFVFYI
jgi:hypothetical protein